MFLSRHCISKYLPQNGLNNNKIVKLLDKVLRHFVCLYDISCNVCMLINLCKLYQALVPMTSSACDINYLLNLRKIKQDDDVIGM